MRRGIVGRWPSVGDSGSFWPRQRRTDADHPAIANSGTILPDTVCGRGLEIRSTNSEWNNYGRLSRRLRARVSLPA